MKSFRIKLIEKRIYYATIEAHDKDTAISFLLNHPDQAAQPEPPEIENITATTIQDE
jgi:hypothetical protein